jgi:hypothetical protein
MQSDRVLYEHRRRLAVIEERIARYGNSAPIEWSSEADDIRVAIARYRLRKALGIVRPLRRVIDWIAVYERARAFLVAFVVILVFLLAFSFVR